MSPMSATPWRGQFILPLALLMGALVLVDCGSGGGGSGGAPASGGSSGSGGVAGDSSIGGVAGSGGWSGSSGAAGADAASCTPSIPGATCDPVTHCGCSGGQKCFIEQDGTTLCADTGLTTYPYYDCKTSLQCGAGHVCVTGACHPLCDGNKGCAKSGSACFENQVGVAFCSAQCDPLNADLTCQGLTNCDFIDSGPYTMCVRSAGGVGTGACAGDPYACNASMVCTSAGNCTWWCHMGTDVGCSLNQVCAPFSFHPKFNGIEYGYCKSAA